MSINWGHSIDKALIVDKDGTLVRTKSGKTFVNDPEDQEPMKGAPEKLQYESDRGARIFVASNQGGVPRYKSLDSAIAEMRFCMSLFPVISGCFFAPGDGDAAYYVDSDNSEIIDYGIEDIPLVTSYRKPSAGMIQLIQYLYEPRLLSFVGDRPEDEQAAKAAGIPFQWAEEWRGEALQRQE